MEILDVKVNIEMNTRIIIRNTISNIISMKRFCKEQNSLRYEK